MRDIRSSLRRTLALAALWCSSGSGAWAQIQVMVVDIASAEQLTCVVYVPGVQPSPCPEPVVQQLLAAVGEIGVGNGGGQIPVPAHVFFGIVDLTSQQLQVRVRGRNDGCGFREQPANVGGSIPLPIRLETTHEWAEREGVTLAVNGNFFKFAGSVRDNPCSELIGPSVSNGFLNWPPQGQPDLLAGEKVDQVLTTGTLRMSRVESLYQASIQPIASFDQLNQVAAAVTGVPLAYNSTLQQALGPKGADNVARTAVGLGADGSPLTLVVWEGAKNGLVEQRSSGINLTALANFLIEWGAVNVLNLDGSGSSSFYYSSDEITLVSRTSDSQESMRPVVNSFGFVVSPGEVALAPYVYPTGLP